MQKEINWLLAEKYHGKPTQQFKKDVARLKMGEPLDYVIGFCDFLGCKINLSKKPLIPRIETEYWVQKVIGELNKEKNQLQILDIFAGSGCIGIYIMRQIKNTKIIFAEKDKNIIKQIKINCKLNNIAKGKYKIVESDIFLNVKGKYDYIFANPPYIAKNRIGKIQKSVLRYEPKMALFGGNDGLFHISKFLSKAKNFLNPGGKIYMEFDYIQKKDIEKLLKNFGYKKWEFYKDQYNKFRYVVVGNN